MADKAISSFSASVFMDDIRSSIGGTNNYTPKDANDKWIFAEVAVAQTASTNLLDVNDSYLGGATAVATGDKIQWIAIKNTSTTATEGIGIDFNAGTAAWDLKTTMFIGAGEMLIVKAPNATVADLNARSCTMDGTYGYPTAQGTATITVQVAAILDDVA